jgi:hypothetical protein
MLKGSKRYFSMFGMMVYSINKSLQSLFSQIQEQKRLFTLVLSDLKQIQLTNNKIKNQTYQG